MIDFNVYNIDKNGILTGINVVQNTLNIPDVKWIDSALEIDNRKMVETINFPANVEMVGSKSFNNLPNLKTINFKCNNNDIDLALCDSAFENCENLERVMLPANINTIGFSCFANCIKLSKIVLPLSIKSVGYWAFERCNENNIKIIYNAPLDKFKKITGANYLLDFTNVITKEKMKLEDLIESGYSFSDANKFISDVKEL